MSENPYQPNPGEQGEPDASHGAQQDAPYGQAPQGAPYGQPPQGQPGPTFPGQQYPGQPQPGQQYPGQPYPGQPYPGYPVAYDPQAKSRLAAGLLGILVGSLGIHRFYLGYTGIGLAMLLVSVLSLGFLAPFIGIWGLVEGILYLTAKQGYYAVDSTGRPLRS